MPPLHRALAYWNMAAVLRAATDEQPRSPHADDARGRFPYENISGTNATYTETYTASAREQHVDTHWHGATPKRSTLSIDFRIAAHSNGCFRIRGAQGGRTLGA
jgi:hypothetical protein